MPKFKFEANDGKSFFFEARDIFHAIQVLRSNRGYKASEGMITQFHKCKFKITGKSKRGNVVFFDCEDEDCNRRVQTKVYTLRSWVTQNDLHPGRKRKVPSRRAFTLTQKPRKSRATV